MYVHKAWRQENNATAIITARNEACVGWLDENCYLKGQVMTHLIAVDV